MLLSATIPLHLGRSLSNHRKKNPRAALSPTLSCPIFYRWECNLNLMSQMEGFLQYNAQRPKLKHFSSSWGSVSSSLCHKLWTQHNIYHVLISWSFPRFEQKLGELWQKIVQRQHLEPLPRSRSNLPLILNELDFMKDVDIFQVFAGISVTLCCLLTSYVVFKLFLLSSFGNMNLSKPHWGISTIHS